MQELPAVSVVIPTLNEEKYLPLLLESLVRVDAPMEVIVVDGTSTDRTVEVARSFASRFAHPSSLQVVNSKRGVSVQRNLGASRTTHDILLFLDADAIIPSPEWYRNFVSRFVRGGYAIAAPRATSIGFDFRARLIYSIGLPLQLLSLLFGSAYLPGACTMVRRDIFNTVGGFNTDLHVAEDINFSLQAGRAGKAGLFMFAIPVSSRRFRKYGYLYIFLGWSAGVISTFIGRTNWIRNVKYPFGEYGN